MMMTNSTLVTTGCRETRFQVMGQGILRACRRRGIGAILVASCCLLPAFPLLISSPAVAAEQQEDKEKTQRKRSTRHTPTLNERVYKQLGKAQELIDQSQEPGGEGNVEQAREMLEKLVERRTNSPYERASIHNMLAIIAYTSEDYRRAIEHYEQVIIEPEKIPEGLEQSTLYALAQLYFVEDEHENSLKHLLRWFEVVPQQGPKPYIFLAQVYYQNDDYDEAIDTVLRAMEVAREKNIQVQENWWLMLNAMHYRREEYDRVLEILAILVRDFPKPEYWLQLSGIHGQQGNSDTQLRSIDVAYIGNMLHRENYLMNLSGLLMQDDVPYRAGTILEKGIKDGIVKPKVKNLELLANAWLLSHELDKAIKVLAEAAELSDEGNLDAQLALAYYDKGKFAECRKASDGALRKGKLKNETTALETQAMCTFNMNRLDEAREIFEKVRMMARREENESAENRANDWIRYIYSESRRQEQLRQSLSDLDGG